MQSTQKQTPFWHLGLLGAIFGTVVELCMYNWAMVAILQRLGLFANSSTTQVPFLGYQLRKPSLTRNRIPLSLKGSRKKAFLEGHSLVPE